MNEKQLAVGTVTLKNHEICRLFVLPAHQKKGYGRRLMDFAEQKIFECTDICRFDASLPAKAISVSYTHLDVYKRQDVFRAMLESR